MSIQVTNQSGAASDETTDLGNESKESESVKDESVEESDTQNEESSEDDSEENNGEDEESEDSEDSEDSKEENKEDKPRRKSGFKKRIDKLNKRLSMKDQEIEHWRQKALEAEKPQENKTAVEKTEDRSNRPHPDDFEEQEDYIEALTEWKVDQKLSKDAESRKVNEIKSEHQTRVQTFQSKVKDFASTKEDFEDVLEDVDDIVVSPAVQEVLFSSEKGPELIYELAKNPEEYRRINALSPLSAAQALGRIEARIFEKSKPTEKKQVKTTKAPKPLGTVGTRGKGSAKSIYDPGLSQREYEKLRAQQEKQSAY